MVVLLTEQNLKALPNKISLRKYAKPIYHQEGLPACSANSLCAAFNVVNNITKKYGGTEKFLPSRIYAFYRIRKNGDLLGTTIGGNVVDFQTDSIGGLCSEKKWPYFNDSNNIPNIQKYINGEATYKPDGKTLFSLDEAESEAHKYLIGESNWVTIKCKWLRPAPYLNLQQMYDVKKALNKKCPVLVSFSFCSSSFSEIQNDKPKIDGKIVSGVVHYPGDDLANGEVPQGAHAVTIVGYDDDQIYIDNKGIEFKGGFIFQNSWGTGFGDKGFGYFPYNYIADTRLIGDMRYFTLPK